jgi:hypothetical protein
VLAAESCAHHRSMDDMKSCSRWSLICS